MTHGFAASAKGVLCIDFDGTLYERRPLYEEPDPLPGAVAAMKRLKAAGYYLVIYTSRLSPRWLTEAKFTDGEQRDRIEAVLKRDDIPYDEITSDKVPAEWYLDDRAIKVDPRDWPAIVDFILWHGTDA